MLFGYFKLNKEKIKEERILTSHHCLILVLSPPPPIHVLLFCMPLTTFRYLFVQILPPKLSNETCVNIEQPDRKITGKAMKRFPSLSLPRISFLSFICHHIVTQEGKLLFVIPVSSSSAQP